MNLHLRRALLLLPLLSLLLLTLGAADLSAQALDYNYLFVSTRTAGATEDGLAYEPGDIIGAQGLGGAWFMAFDASENGLTANQNVNAFDLTVPAQNGAAAAVPGPIYLTFSQPRVRVPGVTGWVTSSDAVVFEEAQNGNAPEDNYELYFDGSDVGLTTRAEQIDSLSVWQPQLQAPIVPGDCAEGVLFISTAANYRVPGANGGSMTGRGGDVLAFCATNLGPDTAGFWFKAFDAQAAGFAPLRALRNVSINEVGMIPSEGDWELTFSFSSHTDFTAGSFSGEANVIYLYETNGGVVGPVVDLNVDYPMLNGVADGLVIDRYVSPCLAAVGPNC
jgi:hypothetical protein